MAVYADVRCVRCLMCDFSQGTMICGWDEMKGPQLFYIDSDGTRLKGQRFSVGSGATYAYGVLDQGYRYDLSIDEAVELGKRSIFHATHRDAYSGGTINVFCVTSDGWKKMFSDDMNVLANGQYAQETKEAEKKRAAVESAAAQVAAPAVAPAVASSAAAGLAAALGASYMEEATKKHAAESAAAAPTPAAAKPAVAASATGASDKMQL